MPELPEVEALRRSLLPFVKGAKILEVEVRQEKIIAGKGTTRKGTKENTKSFVENISGRKILDIKRRAKNLIIVLDKGIILVHLKMTGQLVFVPKAKNTKISFGGHPIEETEKENLPHKHTYIIFKLNNGTLYYNDVRQFGYVLFFKEEKILEDEKHFEDIGVEPFDKNFTLEYFKEKVEEMAQKTSAPIKKVLLEQKIVVGVGNIYCDEVFWASSVLPTRKLSTLSNKEIKDIYENIKKILDKAINSGGSSVANYLLADGKRGNFADYHNAYQKDGQRCKKKGCAGTIEKITLGGRGTHFCPVHQK
jgi:formamidopyrimidine-DNA glycosylase